MSRDRKARLRKILEIVATRPIETQESLVEALAEEGFEVTQSSASRDVAELGLVKIDGVYRRSPTPAAEEADLDERRVARGVLQVDPAGPWLLLFHTPPGEANAVAIALDRLAWPGIAGTIAGDDTILLAFGDEEARDEVRRRMRRLNPSL